MSKKRAAKPNLPSRARGVWAQTGETLSGPLPGGPSEPLEVLHVDRERGHMTVGPRKSTPGKLTPEVIKGICERIASGQPRNAACAAFDVSDRALRLYRDAHADVDEQLELAEAKGAEWYRTQIATVPAGKDATDDWKRWAWLGERIHPSTLSPPKQRVGLSGDAEGEPIKHDHTITITRDEAISIARKRDSK